MARVNTIALGKMIQMLVTGDPATREELATLTGFHYMTANDYIRVWHKMKVVFIAEWRKIEKPNITYHVPCFSWAQNGEKDTPRPKQSAVERQRLSRARKRLQKMVNSSTKPVDISFDP